MASYTFSTVTNVLPLGVQRAYVPRAARPHLAWACPAYATATSHVLGEHCRLKGDGTAARETRAAGEEEGEVSHEATSSTPTTSPANASSEMKLRALLTTDAASGTQLTLYHDVAAPGTAQCSATAIPSQRRVVALWSPLSQRATERAEESVARFLDGDVPLYVSDDAGNVFLHRWGVSSESGIHEPSLKRHRGEGCDAAGGSEAWTAIAAAHTPFPHSAAAFTPSTLESLFAVTRGAPGWAGLAALSTDNAATPQLVSAREFYHDVRVLDPVQREVVRVYSTSHPPTGLLCPSMEATPHCALVTEGCLATLFDVRCPSAVLSLGEVYAAQAEWAAARAEKAPQESSATSAEEPAAPGARGIAPAAAPPPPAPPLVPGRLTSTVGQVRDVCGTSNPFEVACAVDRALCVYDLRKFSRLFTSSNVLKYVVAGVTAVAGGRGVVCTGIDSEVRLVPLHEKGDTAATAAEALSLAGRVVAQAQKKKQCSNTLKKAEASSSSSGIDVDSIGPGGTFRTRLSTSVSCTSVWQGGWVSTQNLGGMAAVGVSIDGEVFLAQ
ncbi:hypothetical protein N2W54_006568 [Lotmaria passim]